MGQNHRAFTERVRESFTAYARKHLIACTEESCAPRPVTASESNVVSMTSRAGDGRGVASYPEELIFAACAGGVSTEHLVFRREG